MPGTLCSRWKVDSTSRIAPRTGCVSRRCVHGYRSNHRYIVFQVLPHTLGLEPAVWRVLAKCHEVRNLGEYEGDLNVDERVVSDLVAAQCGGRQGERAAGNQEQKRFPMNHNPVVDRDLLEDAMSISGETSASMAITKALEEYIARRSPQGMRDLAGKLGWNPTYGCKRERSGE